MEKKAPKPRKGAPETARAKKPVTAPQLRAPVVVKEQKETRSNIDEALKLSTKTGLKFVISKYLKTLQIPVEGLDKTIDLTLASLAGQSDKNGRALDSLYWFREECSVEIKNGKLYAKDTEGEDLIGGVKIKVVKPRKIGKKKVEPKAVPEEAISPVVESAPVDLDEQEALKGQEGEAPTVEAQPESPAPAETATALSEEAVDVDELVEAEPAPETAPAAEPEPAPPTTPEFITFLTKARTDFQSLRTDFDEYRYDKKKSHLTELSILEIEVTVFANSLAKLPDAQFQSPGVRMLRMQIAALQVEILEFINQVSELAKKVIETPSVITGLETKVQTFAENANTWISEVELITNTSRIPTEKEVEEALDKYTKLLEESNGLRATTSAVETSPTTDDISKQRISPLKDQIAGISLSLEEPVKKLQAFLATHRKLPPAPPVTRPGNGNNVVNLRTVTTSPRNLPVNVDDVLREPSLKNRFADWLRNLTR